MAESYLLDKLKSVELTFQELTRRLADPDIATNPSELQKVAKARSSLEETVLTYEKWQEATEQLAEAKEIYKESNSDPEMKEMAAMEVEELTEQVSQLEEKLKVLLLPKDPNDDKNIMLEIRAGTGGDEASIWAGDLVRMYSRYAETQKWTVKLVSESLADMGGFKEAILEIQGKINKNKWKVQLCPEVTGKPSQFGSVEELLKLMKETGCGICVDFAHLYARYQGDIDYAKVLKKLPKKIHAHFSGIEYGPKGERKHLKTTKKFFEPLAEALIKTKRDVTLICESPQPY